MTLGKVTSNNPLKEFLLPVPVILGSAGWVPKEEHIHQETNNAPSELETETPI